MGLFCGDHHHHHFYGAVLWGFVDTDACHLPSGVRPDPDPLLSTGRVEATVAYGCKVCQEFSGTFTWDEYGVFQVHVVDWAVCERPLSIGWEVIDEATMTYSVSVAAITDEGPRLVFLMAVHPRCAAFILTEAESVAGGRFDFIPDDGSSPGSEQWIALHGVLYANGRGAECKAVEDFFYDAYDTPRIHPPTVAEAALPQSA